MTSPFATLATSARQAHDSLFASDVPIGLLIPGAATPQPATAVLHRVRVITRRDADGRTQRLAIRNARLLGLQDIRHDTLVQIPADTDTDCDAETLPDDAPQCELWAIDEIQRREASGMTVQLVRTITHHVSRSGYRGRA